MQTKKGSALEAILNTGSGFIVAMIVWQVAAAPIYCPGTTFLDTLGITAIFTIVGISRSYVWRRIFNYFIMRKTKV